jgi:hypothetical protein
MVEHILRSGYESFHARINSIRSQRVLRYKPNRTSFKYIRRHVLLNGVALSLNRGAIRQIFEGDTLP